MIDAVLEDYRSAPIAGLKTLDLGCGNGGISDHFAAVNEHYAVDVVDQRSTDSVGYTFKLVSGERIPFEDAFFDVAISNHVIEHVSNQQGQLNEICRTLKPTGCVYLATPNRTSPFMEGHIGNDMVLRYCEMGPLIRACGFDYTEYGTAVAREPERFHGEVRWARFFPTPILRILSPLFPSQIFVMKKSG